MKSTIWFIVPLLLFISCQSMPKEVSASAPRVMVATSLLDMSNDTDEVLEFNYEDQIIEIVEMDDEDDIFGMPYFAQIDGILEGDGVIEVPNIFGLTDITQVASISENLTVLPKNVSIRDTERGKVLVSDNKRALFRFRDDGLPSNIGYFSEEVVRYILDNNPDTKIIVESHTGNRETSYPGNYELSIKRSENLKRYFNAVGVSPDRVIGKSFGESLPEYPSQQELRRYEFVLIESDDDLDRYNKFFATINTQGSMTYSTYNKRQMAYIPKQNNNVIKYKEVIEKDNSTIATTRSHK